MNTIFQLISLLFLLLFFQNKTLAQTPDQITLDECYKKTEQNYPLIKQYELIEKTKNFTLENIAKGNLPKINLAGQATYQSEVTKFPFTLPGIVIDPLSKDQYKIYAEISQSLTDFNITKQQKEVATATAEVETQKIEVDLYTLKDRVNQLFFGVLLLEEQLFATELIKKDLQTGMEKVKVAQQNGMAIEADIDLLQAELLQIDQRFIELNSKRNALISMLSVFINAPISEQSIFEKPQTIIPEATINRPELRHYEAQKNSLYAQSELINKKNIPNLSAFFQGGYARPAFNFLSNEFNPFFIGGLKFNWYVSSFYTTKNEKNILKIKGQSIDIQKETFLFNTNLQLREQNAEITKLNDLIAVDNEIIRLRFQVKTVAAFQLENGIITANDFLNYANAADKARQNKILHEINLLMTQYTIKTYSGN